MADSLSKRAQALFKPGSAVLLPGASNALTARVIEDVGFDAMLITGAGVANTYLGVPDVGLATLTELTDNVSRIREVVEIPMIADGDTGFGNAINMQRTVRLFERAGANGIQMEDQTFPKRCGHFEGKSVVPAEEMVQKIRAASDARVDQDFLILARTDAYAVEGFESALERLALYQEAGADLLFLEAPQTVEELARIPKEVPGRHICNLVFGGKTPMTSREKLSEMGFAGIIYANAALQASLKAMLDVLGHLHSHGDLLGVEDAIASFELRQKTVKYNLIAQADYRYAVPNSAG